MALPVAIMDVVCMSHKRGEPRLTRESSQTMHVSDNLSDVALLVCLIQCKLGVEQLVTAVGPSGCGRVGINGCCTIRGVIAADT